MKIKMSNNIRRITYHLLLVKMARVLHINRFLKGIYCRLSISKDSIISLSVRNIKAKFYIFIPVELRIIETSVEQRYGRALYSGKTNN